MKEKLIERLFDFWKDGTDDMTAEHKIESY